jgi:hypothetical protein
MLELRRGLIVVCLVSGGLWWTGLTAQEQPPAKKDVELRAFMRKKLDASSKILEGLCTEDAALIAEGARALNQLSTAEKWRVSNDPLYRQFSQEFQRVTQKLGEAAEKGNFDDVALKWMDATMACVDCHKWARGVRVAKP